MIAQYSQMTMLNIENAQEKRTSKTGVNEIICRRNSWICIVFTAKYENYGEVFVSCNLMVIALAREMQNEECKMQNEARNYQKRMSFRAKSRNLRIFDPFMQTFGTKIPRLYFIPLGTTRFYFAQQTEIHDNYLPKVVAPGSRLVYNYGVILRALPGLWRTDIICSMQ